MKFPTFKVVLGLACLLVTMSFTSVAKADTFSYTSFYATPYNPVNGSNTYAVSSSYTPYSARDGSAFVVDSGSILVAELGAFAGNSETGPKPPYNDPGYGSNETTTAGITTTNIAYTVALYDVTTSALLGYETIAAGAVVDSDGFIYAAIVPLTLTSGDTYSITTFAGLANQSSDYYDPAQNPDAPYTPYSRTYYESPPESGPYGYALQSGDDITFVGATDDYNAGNPNTKPSLDTGFLYQSIGGNLKYTVLAVPEPSDLAYMAIGGAVLFFTLRRKMANNPIS